MGKKYSIPKKGTPEYVAVKALQMEGGAKSAPAPVNVKERMLARIAKSKEVREKPLEEARMTVSERVGRGGKVVTDMLIPQPGGFKSPSLYSKEALKKADKKKVRKVRSDKGVKRGSKKVAEKPAE
jgi:hypothetical protein